MRERKDLPYVRPARLADVMALIQVLALHRYGDRSGGGLEDEMQGCPRSAAQWEDVARQHPEFFRLDPNAKLGVSLISRHSLPLSEHRKRPALPTSFTAMLLRTAIDLHDRQLHRSEEWKTWIRVVEGICNALAALVGALIGSGLFSWLIRGA